MATPRLAYSPQPMAVFDMSVALEYVGGDTTLLREVVGICLEEFTENMPLIWQALRKGDCSSIDDVAHVLQTQLATVGARPAAEAARELEMAARAGDLLRSKQWTAALETELGRLVPLLNVLRDRAPAIEV